MPIHLQPMSRRRFLVSTAVAAAGMTFTPRAFSDELERIALFSDTHIAADPATRRSNVNMTEHLKRVVQEVVKRPVLPSSVFINGDCAFNKGELGDYGTFLKLLTPLLEKELPVHLTLGNHDERQHFWQATPWGERSARPVQDRQVGMVSTRFANWFLLDSLRETNETPGEFGPSQLEWLDLMLKTHVDKPAIVMGHHNVNQTPMFKESIKTVVDVAGRRLTPAGIKDTDAFLEVLAGHAHVAAYFCGHTHQWNVLEWKGIHFVNLPVVAYKFLPEDPAGWVAAELSSSGMSLELRALEEGHKCHGQKVVIDWRKAG
ncbi:MAG: metallophosphoesterase [Planctomycetota bacterium]